jgi:ammonia channel protein AmtB
MNAGISRNSQNLLRIPVMVVSMLVRSITWIAAGYAAMDQGDATHLYRNGWKAAISCASLTPAR